MKKWIIGIAIVLITGIVPLKAHAMDSSTDETIDEYMEELNFSEIDAVLKEQGTGIEFKDLVKKLLSGEEIDKGELLKKVMDIVFKEVLAFRKELLEILLLCIVFAILYNFTNIFENPAVTEISFYMVYMLVVILLMISFFVL